MIRFIFLLGFFVSIGAVSAQSQKPAGTKSRIENVRLGIRAGFSIGKSQVRYDPVTFPDAQGKAKGGFIGGLFVAVQVSQNFTIQPELLLVGKGVKQRFQDYDYSNRLSYLDLPINFLYKPRRSTGSFFIGGGPSLAILTGTSVYFANPDSFKQIDVGVNVLMGYEIPIGFSFNLHYNHGFLNVSENKSSIPVVKNRYIGFTVGYLF